MLAAPPSTTVGVERSAADSTAPEQQHFNNTTANGQTAQFSSQPLSNNETAIPSATMESSSELTQTALNATDTTTADVNTDGRRSVQLTTPNENGEKPATTKKRKYSHGQRRACSVSDSDEEDDTKSVRSNDERRQCSNHSEIEKRRRDKMNSCLAEIAALVPSCSAFARKQDKQTVLKHAVTHIRTLTGTSSKEASVDSFKPDCLNSAELLQLLNELDTTNDGFSLSVNTHSGRIIDCSEKAETTLGMNPTSRSIFEIIHPEYLSDFKNYFTEFTNTYRARPHRSHEADLVTPSHADGDTIDSFNSEQPFTCYTYLVGGSTPTKCSGFVRRACNHSRRRSTRDRPSSSTNNSPADSCPLLLYMTSVRSYDATTAPETPNGPFHFRMKLALDAKIVQVDWESTVVHRLGFLSSDLLGRSYYDFVHPDDLIKVAELHSQVLKCEQMEPTDCQYRFRTRRAQSVIVCSVNWMCVTNPFTERPQSITVLHSALPSPMPSPDGHGGSDGGVATTEENKGTMSSRLLHLLTKLPTDDRTTASFEPGPGTSRGAGQLGTWVVRI